MRVKGVVRGLVLALAVLVACDDSAEVASPDPTDGEIFRSYVSIGDSYAAGFMSDGINAETQRASFAALLANQVGTRFALPLLAGRGCPPPVIDFTTGSRGPGATALTCDLRDASSNTGTLNNVAVPGAKIADVLSPTGPSANPLTTLFLGGRSQMDRALEAQPTFVTVAIIGNDLLGPAGSGILAANGRPTYTPVDTYVAAYKQVVDRLTAAGVRRGVLFGTANIVNVPILFPAAALQNAQVVDAMAAASRKQTVTVHPNCAGSTALISLGIIQVLQVQPGSTALLACAKNTVPGTPLGDAAVLDAAEQAEIVTAVNRYNSYIRAKADSAGFAYFDVNTTLTRLRQQGLVRPLPDFTDRNAPFGAAMSRDPVHASPLGHRYLVNDLIDVINAKYGTSIAKVSVQ